LGGIGFGTTELHVLRAGELADAKFIFYLTISHPFRAFGEAMMYGAAGQKRVPESFLRDFELALPSLPEQRAIAAFLDRETAKIDALIAKKQRLIELLQEKRAALISHAVTKGLDPSVRMQDSGIEWIGSIPEHWKLLPLRRVVAKFVDYRGKTPEKAEDGIPLVTARNIRDGKLDFSESREFIKEEDYENWMVRGLPKAGDVLVTTEAPLGAVAQIVDTYVALAQRLILLKAARGLITNDYLKYHFLSTSGQGELWTRATGSTAIGIKAWRFKETLVTVPPLDEQLTICKYLDLETARIEAPIATIQRAIDRLQEYRTALISAAVTGKIDVREAIQ
jgi:type I restriction enzyme S subunit